VQNNLNVAAFMQAKDPALADLQLSYLYQVSEQQQQQYTV
jgi:hypothetical protein